MFCKNCGFEINDDAVFCKNCGTSLNNDYTKENQKVEDNCIMYSLKPIYVIPYKIITTGIRTFLFALFIILYFFEGSIIDIFKYFGLPVMLIITLYVIIKLFLEKKQYENLEYNFYNTKIEYVDGFLNKQRKELKYKFIRETVFTQNIFERMFDIGKIKIYTNASSGTVNQGHGNGYNNGIVIHCVKNTREQYQIIKDLIDRDQERY